MRIYRACAQVLTEDTAIDGEICATTKDGMFRHIISVSDDTRGGQTWPVIPMQVQAAVEARETTTMSTSAAKRETKDDRDAKRKPLSVSEKLLLLLQQNRPRERERRRCDDDAKPRHVREASSVRVAAAAALGPAACARVSIVCRNRRRRPKTDA
jgi:hypothetical protein